MRTEETSKAGEIEISFLSMRNRAPTTLNKKSSKA